jgi:hypothetical protein
MGTTAKYVDGVDSQIPPSGMKGRVLNNKEGMKQPGNKLPSKKHGMNVANKAGFRAGAAKSMMR